MAGFAALTHADARDLVGEADGGIRTARAGKGRRSRVMAKADAPNDPFKT